MDKKTYDESMIIELKQGFCDISLKYTNLVNDISKKYLNNSVFNLESSDFYNYVALTDQLFSEEILKAFLKVGGIKSSS